MTWHCYFKLCYNAPVPATSQGAAGPLIWVLLDHAQIGVHAHTHSGVEGNLNSHDNTMTSHHNGAAEGV